MVSSNSENMVIFMIKKKRFVKGLAIHCAKESGVNFASSGTNFTRSADFVLEFGDNLLTFHNSKCIVVISIPNESVSVEVNSVHLV